MTGLRTRQNLSRCWRPICQRLSTSSRKTSAPQGRETLPSGKPRENFWLFWIATIPGFPITSAHKCSSSPMIQRWDWFIATALRIAIRLGRRQIPISTVVVRKSALEKAGLFDEALARCDDYDMWIRTAFHGAKIGYGRRVQARLNEGRPGSLGASEARVAEAYWRI